MFTGIVTDIGEIRELEQRGDLRARIATGYDTAGIDLGASIAGDGRSSVDASAAAAIACDGVCLTVVRTGADWFDVDVSAETVSKTNLGGWNVGYRINLERALRVGDELGGHIVSGHIDGVAEVVALRDDGDSTRVTLRAPEALARFIAPKGSVALNGTSLTVPQHYSANTIDFPVQRHRSRLPCTAPPQWIDCLTKNFTLCGTS